MLDLLDSPRWLPGYSNNPDALLLSEDVKETFPIQADVGKNEDADRLRRGLPFAQRDEVISPLFRLLPLQSCSSLPDLAPGSGPQPRRTGNARSSHGYVIFGLSVLR